MVANNQVYGVPYGSRYPGFISPHDGIARPSLNFFETSGLVVDPASRNAGMRGNRDKKPCYLYPRPPRTVFHKLLESDIGFNQTLIFLC